MRHTQRRPQDFVFRGGQALRGPSSKVPPKRKTRRIWSTVFRKGPTFLNQKIVFVAMLAAHAKGPFGADFFKVENELAGAGKALSKQKGPFLVKGVPSGPKRARRAQRARFA